jgi:phosphatidylglycerophosphatase A
LGFPLFFALLATGCLSGFLGLWLITAGAAVWLCGRAERILGSTDPGCIVLDEIVAVPLCFLAWVLWLTAERGRFPAAMEFLAGRAWIGTLLSFAGFRLLDIAKPWPIRKLQELPGGWGVVADDLAAGAGVSAGSWLVLWLLGNS